MLEPSSQQFYLGWKPNESREGDAYEIPDATGQGAYSGTVADPATIDYYTDEAFIITLLATGSTTHPVPLATQCAWIRQRDAAGLIQTYPGSLFTYQFLHAFMDTRTLNLPACPGEQPVDWYANSRQAIWGAITYAEQNPPGYKTYGPNAWGLSAAEGPDDEYRAYAAPPLAINSMPEQDGTVTYYPMLSAVSFGDDLRSRVIQALRAAWQRNDWHARFGLPDVFNDEISQMNLQDGKNAPTDLIRTNGPWVQRALFAIDQGPMLLHLENAHSGLIWNLLAANANISRALARLRVPLQVRLEGEDGSGDGVIEARSNASGAKTVWLHAGESRTLTFQATAEAQYDLNVRYSNDNSGPLETVAVTVDGAPPGQFAAQDTGDGGYGWNNFLTSGVVGSVNSLPGEHQVQVSVSGGDGYGVEIDVVELNLKP